jgi:hypothetical protein
MNLFELIVKHGGAITSDELAEQSGAEELLISMCNAFHLNSLS